MTIPKQLLQAKICNEENCKLQERIDKAINYIMTNHCLHLLDKSIINSKELIDILRGVDDDKKK